MAEQRSEDEFDAEQPASGHSDSARVSSFGEVQAADRAYWHSRTPQERLAALELMRQKAYGYDPATTRLQKALEITQVKKDR